MPHPLRSPKPCFLLAGLLFLGLCGLSACGGPSSTPPSSGRAAEADQEWLWLQRTQQDLDHKREQLAASGEPGSRPTVAAGRRGREVDTEAQELYRRLVDFLNAHPPVQGEPLTHRQQAALRMKSDEDLVIAREHVEKGGDYQRAAEICEAALAVDPDNAQLKEELQKIHAARFMTSERFFQAKKGMTPPEVREILGTPNPRNVRGYPERGIEAWFYPRDEAGTAAGVWFEKRPREDETRVYQLDFDAVKPGAPPAPAHAMPEPKPGPAIPAPR